jgi:mono/diheme cytochrome c family protein
MRLKSIAVAVAVTCVSALILVGCTLSSRPTLPTSDLLTPAVLPTSLPNGENAPIQPPNAEAGAAIYDEKCAACHGSGGRGDGTRAEQIRAQGNVVANLVDDSRRRAAKPIDWHILITNGRIQNLMPGFSGSLNAQDRWDVQAYVWSLGTISQSLNSGQTMYVAQCSSCHGTNGETRAGDMPLALNDPRFLADRSLLDIVNGMQRGTAHATLTLSDSDRFAIADAVRALSYRYIEPTELRRSRNEGNGVIQLQARNASVGGATPINLPVTLRVLDVNGEVLSQTAQLDSTGVVTFAQLPTRADYFFQAEVDYLGGRFYGPPMQFPLTVTAPISEVLPVFETTHDASQISIGELHFFVQSINEGTATMVEFYQFDNASDKAFVGEGQSRRTLKLSLPKDAQNLRFDGLGLGRRFEQDGEIIWDTDVTVPGAGAQRVTMIYEVPYRDGRVFNREVFYPVKAWDVILPEVTGPGTPLMVKGLTDRGKQQMGDGTSVLLFVGTAMNTPGALTFEMTGQPLGVLRPGTDTRDIGFGLIAFGVVVGLAYFLFMRVRTIRTTYADLPKQRDAMLRQLALLDDEFAVGKLNEREYQKRRAQLKEEIKDAWE